MPRRDKSDLNTWIIAARQVAKLPDGTATATECMKRAEAQATTPAELAQVAAAWLQCLSDQQATVRCMEKAEAVAQAGGHDEIGDYIALATAYEHYFNEPSRAEIWRQNAAEAAGRHGASGWLYAAEAARKIHRGNRPLALHYMAQAEANARDCRDWITTAETWKRTFRNKKAGERCLRESQEHATSSQDWQAITDTWLREFKNHEAGVHCLTKATETAKSYRETLITARLWMTYLSRRQEAMKSLKQTEAMATTTRHWLDIGEVWHRELHEVTESRRCLESAEQAAQTASEWGSVAACWRELHDDEANANRCYSIGYGEIRSLATIQSQVDAIESQMIDTKILNKGGITRTGYLENSKRYPGTWGDQKSDRRPGCSSRLYSFTIAVESEVGILLLARASPHLYLMTGETAEGPTVDEGKGQPFAERPTWTHAAATYGRLPAGTYTVEATTECPCDENSFELHFALEKPL